MKSFVKRILQMLLGFDNYLVVFSWFKVKTLSWDNHEGHFIYFLKMISEDGIILDIGANIGIMTVHFARKFPHSTIYAIEPVPENITSLKKIIRFFKLKNVIVFECALGNREGEIEMVMPVLDKVKMQGLSHVIDPTIEKYNDGERYKVPIHRLDDMPEILSLNKKITAIKIDAENYEYWVFEGGRQTILKHRPVIYCELWENIHRTNCLELIRSFDYEIKVLISGALEVYNPSLHKSLNFFFIPNSR